MAAMPGEMTFSINSKLLANGVTASDEEVGAAVAFAFRELKLVVEPGGAVALAALLAGRIDAKGKIVVIVLSGGNVDRRPVRQTRRLIKPFQNEAGQSIECSARIFVAFNAVVISA